MKRLMTIIFSMMMVCMANAWEPQTWRKYIVDLEVKQDTVPQPSIMLKGLKQDKKVNPKAYQCGTFYVYQPGIFEEEDNRRDIERAARGDYSTGDFISDLIFDTIELFVK